MRLVYVPGSLNPGGAETQTARHVVRMQERGHWVPVILPHGAGDMPGNLRSYLERNGVPMISLVQHKDKRKALESTLVNLNADVVHTVGYPVTLGAMLAAYKVSVPVRVIRLDNTGFTRQQYPQEWVYELAGMSAATHVIGNSSVVFS